MAWKALLVVLSASVLVGTSLILVTGLQYSTEQLWEIGAVVVTLGLFLRSLRAVYMSPRRLFSPRVAYPVAYSLYFTIGTMNLTTRGGWIDPSLIYYFGLGLLCFFAGGWFVDVVTLRRLRETVNSEERELFPASRMPALRICAAGLVIGGVGSLVFAWVLVGGIPLFDDPLRLGLNSYLTALSQACWVGLLFFGYRLQERNRVIHVVFALLLVATLTALSLGGYRSPIVLAATTAIVAVGLVSRRLRFFWIAVAFGLIFVAATVIPLVRSSFLYGYRITRNTYINQGVPEGLLLLGPVHAVAREGPFVFSMLENSMRGRTLNGALFLSDWQSIMPGKQDNSRLIITNILNNPTDTSKTPSVLGSLYVDFGTLGICVGMFVLSLFLHLLYKGWQRKRSLPLLLWYSYSLAYHLVSIHTGGLLEPVYVLTSIFLFATPAMTHVMSQRVPTRPAAVRPA